jgi:hypothetical protein
MYMDQVQGLCAILGYELKITRVAFDRRYWDQLRPSLVAFYSTFCLHMLTRSRILHIHAHTQAHTCTPHTKHEHEYEVRGDGQSRRAEQIPTYSCLGTGRTADCQIL